VWIVVVPVLAKLLSRIEQEATLTLGSRELTVDLGLPFSWQLFFYGALVTSAANLLYSLTCPWLVKSFATFTEFTGEGRGPIQIREQFTNLVSRKELLSQDFLANAVTEYHITYVTKSEDPNETSARSTLLGQVSNRQSALSLVEKYNIDPSKASEAFWYVRDYFDQSRRPIRWLLTILYALGLGLFGWVLGQNVWFVVTETVSAI